MHVTDSFQLWMTQKETSNAWAFFLFFFSLCPLFLLFPSPFPVLLTVFLLYHIGDLWEIFHFMHSFIFINTLKISGKHFSFLFISSFTFCPCVSFSFLSSIHSFVSVSSIIWCGCCHSSFFPGLSVVLRIEHVRVGCSMGRSSYKTQRDIQTQRCSTYQTEM